MCPVFSHQKLTSLGESATFKLGSQNIPSCSEVIHVILSMPYKSVVMFSLLANRCTWDCNLYHVNFPCNFYQPYHITLCMYVVVLLLLMTDCDGHCICNGHRKSSHFLQYSVYMYYAVNHDVLDSTSYCFKLWSMPISRAMHTWNCCFVWLFFVLFFSRPCCTTCM